MTTLLPVRTAAGALQLLLVPEPATPDRLAWALSAARPRDARWEPVGGLVVVDSLPVTPDPDPPVRFDPIRNLPEGTSHYRWIRLVRDPACSLAAGPRRRPGATVGVRSSGGGTTLEPPREPDHIRGRSGTRHREGNDVLPQARAPVKATPDKPDAVYARKL